jgi:hypothetical protein
VLRVFPVENRQFSQYIDGQMIPAGDYFPHDMIQRLARGFIAACEVVSDPGPDR